MKITLRGLEAFIIYYKHILVTYDSRYKYEN